MKVTEKVIDGNSVKLAVLNSGNMGCNKCVFLNECTNPPVNRVMPCFSCDREDKTSVYYKRMEK